MPAKTLSIISAIITAVLVILFSTFIFFITLVALNGFSDREGTAAVTINLICSGGGAILSAILAGWLTRLAIEKFNWNKVLAIIVSILAGTTLGTVAAFGSLILSVIVAEAMWQAR
jgi:hypothetical protein